VATLVAVLLIGGCSREAPDVRAVRKSAERYIGALAHQDVASLRTLSTNVASTGSVRGGRVLAIGPPRTVAFAALDSLAEAATRRQMVAGARWAGMGELEAESLFQVSLLAARAHIVYRNAQRAALASARRTDLPGGAPIETRRVQVRIRYGGSLVGNRPVDRELYLRALRAPAGAWIVYSLYLPEDDPIPGAN